jgi:hypothetical protein
VRKSADPAGLQEPGGIVAFTVQVENNDVEAITILSLIDDVYGDVTDVGNSSLVSTTCQLGTIPAAGVYRCSFQTEIYGEPGSYTDRVEATVRDNEGNTVRDSDDATVTVIDILPAIQVRKTAQPTELPKPGGTVSFTVGIDNQGVEEVVLVSLVDDVYGDITDTKNPKLESTTCQLATIPTGGSYQCVFVGQVTGEAGGYVDEVIVSAVDNEGNVAKDGDDATVSIVAPAVQVTVEADVGTVNVGETVHYTYTVRNVGDVTLTDVALSDERLGAIELGSTTLGPGQTTIGTAMYVACATDLPGPLTSTATVTAKPSVGSAVSDTDVATVRVQSRVFLPIVKRSAVPSAQGSTPYLTDVASDGVQADTSASRSSRPVADAQDISQRSPGSGLKTLFQAAGLLLAAWLRGRT